MPDPVRDRQEAPPAVAPPPGNPRFPLMDSLRAIAAIGVLTYHSGGALEVNQNGRIGTLTGHMDAGVTLFFLISGFLIYRPFVAARFLGTPAPRWSDYLRRRGLRIIPAYWVALTIFAVVLKYGDYFWSHFWVFYGFGQVYSAGTVKGGLVPAWTLCVEISFYVVLPLFALAMARALGGRGSPERRMRAELVVLLVLGVASALYRAHLHEAEAGTNDLLYLQRTILGTFLWFAIGMALAVASVAAQLSGRTPAPLRWLARRPLVPWLAAVPVFVLVSYSQKLPGDPVGGPVAAPLVEHVGYGLVALLLIIPAVFEEDGAGLPRRILRWRVLAWLGLISYGLYLWQAFAVEELYKYRLQTVMNGHPFVLFTSGVLLATVLCAAASYYIVERPLLRFKDRRRRPAAPKPLQPAPERASG